MIRITQLKANLPFENCSLRFMIKTKPSNVGQEPFLIPLQEYFIEAQLNEILELPDSADHTESLILCVLALTEQSKVYIGHIDLNLKELIQNRKQQLGGLIDQKGYIVYSLYPPEAIRDKGLYLREQMSQVLPININYNGDQRDFSKIKLPQIKDQTPYCKQKGIIEENEKLLDLVQQIKLIILSQSLKNEQYKNKLNENQIFQLKNKERIEALLGNI